MNYSEQTDDQINKAVSLAITGQCVDGCYLDYCNDDSVIGPIIWENKITMDSPTTFEGFWNALAGWDYHKDSGYKYSARNKNPKRAAAICFLMMQDAKDG